MDFITKLKSLFFTVLGLSIMLYVLSDFIMRLLMALVGFILFMYGLQLRRMSAASFYWHSRN